MPKEPKHGGYDRHPGTGRPLRAMPVKGGHGGWGVPGSELDDAPAALNERDPNYVPEEEEEEDARKAASQQEEAQPQQGEEGEPQNV
ncbi:hypothetical protein QOT17_005609 [Balamuthia mandrillaris]